MFIYKIINKVNGKVYIGKTEKSDIALRWKRHLADHKRYNTKLYNAIKKYGSDEFEIYVIEKTGKVSKERLNEREKYWIEVLEPEYNMTKGGDGGWINDQTGKKWKIKDTSKMRNKKTVTEAVIDGRKKLSGGSNYQSVYFIFTPWGKFETWMDAIKAGKKEREKGNVNVLTNGNTLRKYCLNNIQLNIEGRRTPKEWRGKYTKDLGFYIKDKHE